MYKKYGQFCYSPSDLTNYIESPFASWMDRFSIECPEQAPEKNPPDALMTSLARKGYAHEAALEAAFIGQGLSLVKVEGKSEEEKQTNTLSAMYKGIDVIVQARLELEQFGGYADFLIKVSHTDSTPPSRLGDYHYEVWDTKLSNKIKPTFVIQLCCYAEMLESIQGCTPEFITVALGNDENERLRTDDFYYYYRTLKSSFLFEQNNFSPTDRPDPVDSKSWGDWSVFSEQLLLEKDHLFQVATITRGQIKKLQQSGITTMQQLADSALSNVSGINPVVLTKLKSQADLPHE